MSFKKNTAITGFTFGMVSATDGSDITTTSPVGYYTLDGGTQTAIGDTTGVHEGNGQWSFDLLAAEMNGDIVGLTFTHGSGMTVHFTIKTDTKIVSELNDAITAPTSVENRTEMDSNSVDLNAILLDTNELQTNQGNWLTATGFATNTKQDTMETTLNDVPTTAEFEARTILAASYFDPAIDAVANVTLTTTCTNNTDMRGTDSANTVVPTSASAQTSQFSTTDGLITTVDTVVDAIKVVTDGLVNLTAAEVATEISDALNTDANAEIASVPAANAALSVKLSWLFALSRNKGTQTSTTKTLLADDETTTISTSTVSDDGTTFTRGEYS